MIAALVLREPTSSRRWIGAGIAMAGAALIAVAGGGAIRLEPAALIILAAAIAQATYHTTQKPLLRRLTGFEVTAYATWVGTAIGGVVVATSHLVLRLPARRGAT